MGARKKEALEQFNRNNILSAAKELFETKGVENTTVDDIAKLADYSKSTIYVYFKSKEDIYNSIVRDYISVLANEIEISIESEKDFEDGYYKMCDCLVSFEEKYPKYYSTLMGEENSTNSRKKPMALATGDNELNDVLRRFLTKGVNEKILRTDMDIQPAVLYVWSAISGIIQVAERKRDSIDQNFKMTKEEYLRYSFRTFYDSLIRR